MSTPLSAVHTRATAAAKRNGGTGELRDIEHKVGFKGRPPETIPFSNLIRGAFEVTTHTDSGSPAVVRVPHSILAILVTIALATVAAGFWVVSSVTEMKTNLAVIQGNQKTAQATYSGNLRLMIAYTTNETNRVEFMKGLLTQAQQRQVFEWEKANPKPPLPSTDTEEQ